MIIQSIKGDVLYKSQKISFRTALEEAVKSGINLSHGDFRGQKLYQAQLDGILAPGACFWGADCRGVDMAGGDLRDADLRMVDLKDACLAESNLGGANLSGTYLNNTILRQCNMAGTTFSCPSLFDCDLTEVHSFHRAIYCHRGEIDVPLSPLPFVISGTGSKIVLFQNMMLQGNTIIKPGHANDDMRRELTVVKSTIDRFL